MVAVVVAAGRSRRMAVTAPVNKMLLEARGRTVLVWTLSIFERSPDVSRIYVTASEEDVGRYEALIAAAGLGKVAQVVVGGDERQASVYRALQAVRDGEGGDPLVAIHDGARPLLSDERLAEVLRAAEDSQGALLCVPAKETLKRVREGHVVETVVREEMMVAQTPQVFGLGALLRAHATAQEDGFKATDDASLIERAGGRVRVVIGDYENIKITTPEDLELLEGLLRRREVAAAHG